MNSTSIRGTPTHKEAHNLSIKEKFERFEARVETLPPSTLKKAAMAASRVIKKGAKTIQKLRDKFSSGKRSGLSKYSVTNITPLDIPVSPKPEKIKKDSLSSLPTITSPRAHTPKSPAAKFHSLKSETLKISTPRKTSKRTARKRLNKTPRTPITTRLETMRLSDSPDYSDVLSPKTVDSPALLSTRRARFPSTPKKPKARLAPLKRSPIKREDLKECSISLEKAFLETNSLEPVTLGEEFRDHVSIDSPREIMSPPKEEKGAGLPIARRYISFVKTIPKKVLRKNWFKGNEGVAPRLDTRDIVKESM